MRSRTCSANHIIFCSPTLKGYTQPPSLLPAPLSPYRSRGFIHRFRRRSNQTRLCSLQSRFLGTKISAALRSFFRRGRVHLEIVEAVWLMWQYSDGFQARTSPLSISLFYTDMMRKTSYGEEEMKNFVLHLLEEGWNGCKRRRWINQCKLNIRPTFMDQLQTRQWNCGRTSTTNSGAGHNGQKSPYRKLSDKFIRTKTEVSKGRRNLRHGGKLGPQRRRPKKIDLD